MEHMTRRPGLVRSLRRPQMSSAVLESRPEVGSSKSNKLGRREGGKEGRSERQND